MADSANIEVEGGLYRRHHSDDGDGDGVGEEATIEQRSSDCPRWESLLAVLVIDVANLFLRVLFLIPIIGVYLAYFLCLVPYASGYVFNPLCRLVADVSPGLEGKWLFVRANWIFECMVYALIIWGAGTPDTKLVLAGAIWHCLLAALSSFVPYHDAWTHPFRRAVLCGVYASFASAHVCLVCEMGDGDYPVLMRNLGL